MKGAIALQITTEWLPTKGALTPASDASMPLSGIVASPLRNRLLAGLTQDELDQLRPRLAEVKLARNQVLFTPGEPVEHVYFVEQGMVSHGHDSYPRAVRTELGKHVRHRTSRYLNNRVEQDHRGIKGRYRPMRAFKCVRSAARFCRGYDELRNFLRPRPHNHQPVSANHRRLHVLCAAMTAISILQTA